MLPEEFRIQHKPMIVGFENGLALIKPLHSVLVFFGNLADDLICHRID